MFIGEYNHTIDEKGRLIIPSKYREKLGQDFVITKGLDACLFVFTRNEWSTFQGQLDQLPLAKKNNRKFVRFFLSGAQEGSLDKQGRVLISGGLREFASLQKEVVLIGVSNRIEIWSKSLWDAYNNEDDFDVNELAENMDEIGI